MLTLLTACPPLLFWYFHVFFFHRTLTQRAQIKEKAGRLYEFRVEESDLVVGAADLSRYTERNSYPDWRNV